MSVEPLVSVIVPVYKVERYLDKMINSVLNQTFKDFELYLVDDGSPDNCGQICDMAAKRDSRVKVIHKQNGGAADARNMAMEVAQGKYFHFVDSDDWIEPTMLENLVTAAEQNNSMLTITGFCMEYYENGKYSSYDVSPESASYLTSADFRANAYKYFNRSLLSLPVSKLYLAQPIREKHIVFPNTMWDDLHFNMNYLMDITSVVFVPGAPYHYFRSRPGSETTLIFDTDRLYRKRKEQFEHILKLYQYWGVSDETSMNEIHSYYVSRLLQCIQEITINPKLSTKEKKEKISEILSASLTEESLQRAKPKALLMRIAILPMYFRSVGLCFLMGKAIGLIQLYMTNVFYYLRAKVVHGAKERLI